MIRKQIYLEKLMIEQIKEIAEKQDISQSEVIRQSINEYIKKEQASGEVKDPIMELIGIIDTPLNNNSENHDDIIYGGKSDEL